MEDIKKDKAHLENRIKNAHICSNLNSIPILASGTTTLIIAAIYTAESDLGIALKTGTCMVMGLAGLYCAKEFYKSYKYVRSEIEKFYNQNKSS